MSPGSEVTIRRAKAAELGELLAMLKSVGLPTDGFTDHLETALVALVGNSLAGSAELELYGDSALLRSLAVVPAAQGRGLGRSLVEAALALASDRGVQRVYLLTETAQDYFPRFGFRSIHRDQVDELVQQSVEFTGVCSDRAVAMVRMLQ